MKVPGIKDLLILSKNGYTGYMNKKFLPIILALSLASISFAQTTNSAFDWFSNTSSNQNTIQNTIVIPGTQNTNLSRVNQIQIPQNVLTEINSLKTKYIFNQAQINSLNQIARSYQHILNTPIRNKTEAFTLNVRDVAATNCASSRILGQAMEESVNRIELASLDDLQKRNTYENYSNFLDENTPNTEIIDSCEDEFSENNNREAVETGAESDNFKINLNGVVSDKNILSKCLTLTHFMEFGSKDSEVFPLQNFLMENGYLEMYPTGFFGRNTEFAVKEWQKRHGVDVRGWVGPNTRGSIAGLTCKNQAAYDKAFKGETVRKYTVAKKVLAKTTINQPVKTIIIETTTTSAVEEFKPSTFTNQVNTNNLSSLGATFFTRRNPVNTLYFTYKANTERDDVYTCISKAGENKCESSSNFTKVKQKYEPGNIDTINNNTKWIFNVYYNPNTWGNDGGNIYIRNGLGNISEVYSIKVANTL